MLTSLLALLHFLPLPLLLRLPRRLPVLHTWLFLDNLVVVVTFFALLAVLQAASGVPELAHHARGRATAIEAAHAHAPFLPANSASLTGFLEAVMSNNLDIR